MSWAMDKNHLNELLAKYWQREYYELKKSCEETLKFIEKRDPLDSIDVKEVAMFLEESIS